MSRLALMAYFLPPVSQSSVSRPPAGHRIYGGVEAKVGEFPSIVSLQKLWSDGVFHHHCGGTILDESHILTAAHCVTRR